MAVYADAATNDFLESFKKTAKERARLAPTALLSINLDIPLAVAVVMSVVPRLRGFRAECAFRSIVNA